MIYLWVGSVNSIEAGFEPILGVVDQSLQVSAIRLISIYTTFAFFPYFPQPIVLINVLGGRHHRQTTIEIYPKALPG
jgi:hypothetical protein